MILLFQHQILPYFNMKGILNNVFLFHSYGFYTQHIVWHILYLKSDRSMFVINLPKCISSTMSANLDTTNGGC